MDREAPVETMKASAARQNWSQLLNRVCRGETRVLVEKSGVPVAAIVSARDFERLRKLDEQRQRDFRVLYETQAAFADVPEEELERELARAISEVRAEKWGDTGR